MRIANAKATKIAQRLNSLEEQMERHSCGGNHEIYLEARGAYFEILSMILDVWGPEVNGQIYEIRCDLSQRAIGV